jgi:Leucine-rich repeat (LRR) protein
MSILSNGKEYRELKCAILTNQHKSLVINNKLTVNSSILKKNKMDYLIQTAYMNSETVKHLESLPVNVLENILLQLDYGQIEALKESLILKQKMEQMDKKLLTKKWIQYYTYTNKIVTDLDTVTELKVKPEADDITDLSLLKNLPNLETFIVRYNVIENIEPLANLKKLKKLILHENSITDVTPLANLTNLEFLDLSNNYRITDISSLKNLVKLQTLHLSNNRITDISSIAKLPGLKIYL